MRARQHDRPSSLARGAFTLIELLMVISIIAILLAILVPAVQSALTRAKEAQVVSDIAGLSNAADSFKNKYGVYPPSSITLCEKATDWDTYPASKALIRRIFGTEFDFSIDREINGPDKTGTTTANEVITLNAQQCLVFFLGGLPAQDTNGNFRLLGFSNNARDPFDRTATSRTTFFKNFEAGRLSDGGSGMPVYHDLFNPPGTGPAYGFISTTNASNAYNATVFKDAGGNNITFTFYHQDTTGGTGSPWKPDGIQIISAGIDHEFGTGGVFNAETADTDFASRQNERDNLTNFHGGRLAP